MYVKHIIYFSRFCSDFSHFCHFSSNFVIQKIGKLQHVGLIGDIFRGHSSKNRAKSCIFARQGKPCAQSLFPRSGFIQFRLGLLGNKVNTISGQLESGFGLGQFARF